MATLDSGGGGSEEEDDQQEHGVIADEGATQDPAESADELTQRDPGGGRTGGGGRTHDPRQQADEQLTQRDPGSSGAGGRGGAGGGAAGGSAAEEELTQRDPGSSQAAGGDAGSADSTTQQTERAFVERQIDATLQEGIEGRAGGGRRQEAAREFEREIVEQSDRVDDPSDVAIVERDGRLEPQFSRSAQVDMTVEEFDLKEELVREFKRDRRPKGLGLTPGSAVSPLAEGIDVGDIDEVTMDDAGELGVTFSEDFIGDLEAPSPSSGGTSVTEEELLDAAEQEAETARATVPEIVPFVGGREVSGQVRDVEFERTDDGDVDVTTNERFGDFDYGQGFIPSEVSLGPVGVDIPGGGGEVEDVTGALGDMAVAGGERTGEEVSREIIEERTLLPGAIVEEQLTGDTKFTEQLTRGTGEGVGSLIDQGLNLPQETVEFGAAGGSALVSGEGLDFATDFGDAATGSLIQTGQFAAENPARFGGQLSGSAVATTGGIAAATRVAGPRAGRLVSASVQPGEELAITAARRGVVSSRAARAVPGVREGHIEAGDVESSGGRFNFDRSLDTEAIQAGISNRTPRVSFERDADAGLVEIDGQPVSTLARESAAGAARQARQLPRRAEIAGLRARRQFGERLTDIKFEAQQARARAVEAVPSRGDLVPSDPLGPVRRGGQRVELAGRRGVRGARETALDARFLASETAARTRRAPRVAAERGRIARSRIERDIEDFLIDARFEVEQARGRARDAFPPLPDSEFLSAEGTGRVDVAGLGRGVGTPGFNRPTLPVLELPQSEFLAAEGTGRVDATQLAPGVGRPTFERPTLPELDLPDSEFLAAEGTERVDVAGAASGVGRPSFTRPSLPELDLPESAFLSAEGTGRVDVAGRFPDFESPGRPSVPSPGEFTLRIDRQRTPDEVIVDVDDLPDLTDAEPVSTFEAEIDTSEPSGAGVGSVGMRSEQQTDSGVVVERVIRPPETESETVVDMESAGKPEVETDIGRGRFETLQKTEPIISSGEVTEPTVDVGGATTPGLDSGGELGSELGVDPVVETGIEPGIESGVESRIESRVESPVEPRVESRVESRFESRMEATADLQPDISPRNDRGRGFELWSREFIAPVEENPLQAIDEDLGSFDGLGDLGDIDPL